MFNNNSGYSLADIAAATGNRNGGDGFGGFNGDGAWIFLLFILTPNDYFSVIVTFLLIFL